LACQALPGPVRLLRDKAALTRLLLLLELQRGTHTKLRGLADKLGMTVQGVSNYVQELQRAGLVRAARGRYELTPKGRQALQEGVGELKGFADAAYQRIHVIERCAARAGQRVRAGEPVGLFMEEGVLVARPGARSPSQGVAAQDARAGDLVDVRGLEGLVALRAGRVHVLEVPAAAGDGTARAAQALARWKGRAQRVGAWGTEAHVLAERAGLGPDFAFAPAHACHHAAQLGLDALLLVSPGQLRFAWDELEALNEDAPRPVRIDLARRRA
jgi:putative transcriptional regulator